MLGSPCWRDRNRNSLSPIPHAYLPSSPILLLQTFYPPFRYQSVGGLEGPQGGTTNAPRSSGTRFRLSIRAPSYHPILLR